MGSTPFYLYEGTEWSFFHWDNHEERDSDVTIKIRGENGNNCINNIKLPQKIAKELEKGLEEETIKRQIQSFKEQKEEKIEYGDIIVDGMGKYLMILDTESSICGDIYCVDIYGSCEIIRSNYKKNNSPNYEKWLYMLEKVFNNTALYDSEDLRWFKKCRTKLLKKVG
jgi:hypothetical protein